MNFDLQKTTSFFSDLLYPVAKILAILTISFCFISLIYSFEPNEVTKLIKVDDAFYLRIFALSISTILFYFAFFDEK